MIINFLETFCSKNQVCEILNEKEVYDEDEDDGDFKERYSTMPCVGTRVRRGRDWHYGNQDSNGVGTVIGHTNLGTFK